LRADLEKLDEVSVAFVNAGEITLYLSKAGAFDKKKIGKLTAAREAVLTSATKLTETPL